MYSAVTFHRRGVGLYLQLRSHFVFYDYSEPVIFFLIDYLSIMALFVLIGCYSSKASNAQHGWVMDYAAWLEAIFLNADKE